MYIQIYTPEEAAEREAAQIRRVLRQELHNLYPRMTNCVEDMLLQHFTMPLWGTDYREPGEYKPPQIATKLLWAKYRARKNIIRPGRYEEAIELFLSGGVEFPDPRNGLNCFIVDSRSKPGTKYYVSVGCIAYMDMWECDCTDRNEYAAKDCGGVCAHQLAVLVGFYVMNSLAIEGRARKGRAA